MIIGIKTKLFDAGRSAYWYFYFKNELRFNPFKHETDEAVVKIYSNCRSKKVL